MGGFVLSSYFHQGLLSIILSHPILSPVGGKMIRILILEGDYLEIRPPALGAGGITKKEAPKDFFVKP